jgi:phage terminase Nu1 subunit (DNA packaging protein)
METVVPLLTRTELAAALGVNPVTITKWQGEGLPVAVQGGRGRESKYRMVDVWRWGLERERQRAGAGRDGADLNLPIEHAKLKRAQRLKLEADERRRSGETLERADVARTVGLMIQAIRSGVLRLPQAMASQVVALVESGDGVTVVEAALTGACRDVLRELAAWKEPQEEPVKEAATG